MKDIYSNVHICPFRRDTYGNQIYCELQLEPGVKRVMEISRDNMELTHIWREWHDKVGPQMRNKFMRYVELANQAARINDSLDAGEEMRDIYEDADFENELAETFQKLQPLYKHLLTYVRRKLLKKYGPNVIREDGPLPAQVLGNIWAQDWSNIADVVLPYFWVQKYGVTSEMLHQGFTPLRKVISSGKRSQSVGIDNSRLPNSRDDVIDSIDDLPWPLPGYLQFRGQTTTSLWAVQPDQVSGLISTIFGSAVVPLLHPIAGVLGCWNELADGRHSSSYAGLSHSLPQQYRPLEDNQISDRKLLFWFSSPVRKRMFQMAQEFYTSLGLKPMPPEFWRYSMIEKPNGRKVQCTASAWDFCNKIDYRIKECSEVNMQNLLTTHHEMAHIEYYMYYSDQPYLYREGANPGFHEGISNAIILSIFNPIHMKRIGLYTNDTEIFESNMNFFMLMALKKVAYAPFAYLVDQAKNTYLMQKTESSDTRHIHIFLIIIIICTLIQASEEPHGSCARKGWLLLLFAMAPWERLKIILVTHLLYSPEKTQKTRNITNSRAGEMVTHTSWGDPARVHGDRESGLWLQGGDEQEVVSLNYLSQYGKLILHVPVPPLYGIRARVVHWSVLMVDVRAESDLLYHSTDELGSVIADESSWDSIPQGNLIHHGPDTYTAGAAYLLQSVIDTIIAGGASSLSSSWAYRYSTGSACMMHVSFTNIGWAPRRQIDGDKSYGKEPEVVLYWWSATTFDFPGAYLLIIL
ncbi:hypothetical protein NQ317_019001 [Molorchus minor]|uniref:Angiotensin-converting enzyme n=1 Tax=Molorchus minor TaxID=1323400 RepID=A0ABQ9IRA9_9CUCU|nr:hypothetical protein NQ317_019001 [Molorchus minor]